MKVFEIVYWTRKGSEKHQDKMREYWTGDWKDVTEAATRFCEEYENDLISVAHVLDITRQQGTSRWYEESQATPKAQDGSEGKADG